MSIPRVYAGISAVAAALSKNGIAKLGTNFEDDYQYRRIDDLYDALAPLLPEHRLCILPRVLERKSAERIAADGVVLSSVCLKVAYDIISARDGSAHTIEVFGEALDESDKATAKAMQSAYKYALLQAFCIPVAGTEEADSASPRLKAAAPVTEQVIEPVQGWQQWTQDIEEVLRVCESLEAIGRVQDSNRPLLAAISREQPELYRRLGEAVAQRCSELAARAVQRAAEQDREHPEPEGPAREREAQAEGLELKPAPQPKASTRSRAKPAAETVRKADARPKRRTRRKEPQSPAEAPAERSAHG